MSKFLRIQCECGKDAIVYGDSKSEVKCSKCGKTIVESKGGHAKITCRVLEVLS